LLIQGIEQKSEKEINIEVSYAKGPDSLFMAAETLLGLLGASSYLDANKDKSDFQLFAETTKSFFAVLESSRKENKGLWWDLYVNKFSDLIRTNNCEAFSYYISQCSHSEEVNDWILKNGDKMAKFREWLKRNNFNYMGN